MSDPRQESTATRNAGASAAGVQRGSLAACRWALALFLLMGAVQIFLAGFGAFTVNEGRGDPESAFGPHRTFGFAMGAVALVILVLAVLGRAGLRAIVISAVVLVLVGVGQSLLAAGGEKTSFVGGLHAFDGLLIIGLAGYLFGSLSRAGRGAR